MSPEEIKELVASGYALVCEIDALAEKLKDINAVLIKMGAGTYGSGNAKCQVVSNPAGKVTYPTPADDETIATAKKLCGEESFPQLFDRKVIFVPCQAFDLVAGRILTKAKAARLLTLCGKPGKAGSTYVRWEKPAKT